MACYKVQGCLAASLLHSKHEDQYLPTDWREVECELVGIVKGTCRIHLGVISSVQKRDDTLCCITGIWCIVGHKLGDSS